MKLPQPFYVFVEFEGTKNIHGFESYKEAREYYTDRCEDNRHCLLFAKLEECNQ